MPHRCGHEPCKCDTHGKEYCSTHCADVVAMEEEPTACRCGHVGCKEVNPH